MGALGVSSLTVRTLPPGGFVQICGMWRWGPLFESWADYQPGEHHEFDKAMEKLGPEFVANPAKMEYTIELFRQIPPSLGAVRILDSRDRVYTVRAQGMDG